MVTEMVYLAKASGVNGKYVNAMTKIRKGKVSSKSSVVYMASSRVTLISNHNLITTQKRHSPRWVVA